MVDRKHIQAVLEENFSIVGTYTIDDQARVNVQGEIRTVRAMQTLPLQFGTVTGGFVCKDAGLTSLLGSPHTVGQLFWASNNQLQSLQHGPQSVGTGYWVHTNPLKSLQGAPDQVPGKFWCGKSELQSLVGAPTEVGAFWCGHTPLQSLQGLSSVIHGDLLMSYNADLAMLRTLVASRILFTTQPPAPQDFGLIVNKYAGRGRVGALACAAELIRAGYKGNARW